jgi:predicted DNA-binding transcriptional regulator AlpA
MQATPELRVSKRITSTNKRRDGAVNNMTIYPSADTRKNAETGSALLAFELLSQYVSMGRSRIYALIDEGDFPPPIKIGRSSRWLKTEIDSWISQQAAARQPDQAGA